MADLHPEAWMFEDEPHEKSLAGLSKRRKQPVTDILLWVQCLRHKHRVLPMHLMAYHTVDECQAANGPLVQLTRDLGISAITSPSYSTKHTMQPPSTIPSAKWVASPIQSKPCGLFNSNMCPRCTYRERCRYMHICSLCFKNHPKASCQHISAGNWKLNSSNQEMNGPSEQKYPLTQMGYYVGG